MELYSDKDWRITKECVSLPNGVEKCATRVNRADSVHLVAFTKKNNVLLLREYRPFYGEYIWMIPSGRVDKEIEHKIAAQRELQEETGYRANKLELLCYANYSESIISTSYIYEARELIKDPLPQDEDELIEVHEMPIENAIKKILQSKIVHTTSAFALFRYLHKNT